MWEFSPLYFCLFQKKSDEYLYMYSKNLEKLRFWYKIAILVCEGRQRTVNVYCMVKKQMYIMDIKDLGCIKLFKGRDKL